MKCFLLIIVSLPSFFSFGQAKTIKTDLLVIGGGTGGTAAAIQAARMGVKTILIEPTSMLGGMLTAAGVSCTDGNDQLSSGIWEEFRQALYHHYGVSRLNTGWVSNTNFEPHVGDSIFKAWDAREKNLTIFFRYDFDKIQKKANKVTAARFLSTQKNDKSSLNIKAKIIIDATELGDVLAAAGAGYNLGMDDPAVSGEKEAIEKNDIIQDLTWAAILKDYGANVDKTIDKPRNYESNKYYCCCTDAPCEGKSWNGDKIKMLEYGKLPRSAGVTHDKYMLNWPLNGNDYYVNAVEQTYGQRATSYEQARQQTLGFIYFIQTELGMKNIGLADDELDNGLALIPYNREARRMKGLIRMNINHIKIPYAHTLYRTGISVGDYPVDHHHAQYPGKLPALEFPPIPSFTIPMGCLIPEKVEGLIVCEKGISVTNIVNGTTRLQPVVLLTGQAAGVLAATSIKEGKKPRDVAVRTVQAELLKAQCYLMPFADVRPDDPNWEPIQRVGVTGILKGVGKSENWANKNFFYPDNTIGQDEFTSNFLEYYPGIKSFSTDSILTISSALSFIDFFPLRGKRTKKPIPTDARDVQEKQKKKWEQAGLKNYEADRPITKRQLAVLLDKLADVFNRKQVDMFGAFEN